MALDVNTFKDINNKASEQLQSTTNDINSNVNTFKSMTSVIGVIPEELKDLNLGSQKGE